MSSWCCCWCCLQVLINTVTLGVSLAVAMLMPGGAEKVYAIVGATGVHTFMLHVTAPEKAECSWDYFHTGLGWQVGLSHCISCGSHQQLCSRQ